MNSGQQLLQQIAALDQNDLEFAPQAVRLLLSATVAAGAQDLHLLPGPAGLFVRWRIDGVLQELGCIQGKSTPHIVARLKVVANLLTYRTDVPQEGRIELPGGDVEMRVSTFPTLYGERAAVRLFAPEQDLQRLCDLGLPEGIETALRRDLQGASGAVLAVGPAGSGKTTTMYAALREISAAQGPKSLMTLEDPVEKALPGVSQSQVNAAAGFTFAAGLRSLMRQDPDAILVGEIRDAETAQVALQAAMTGQLVLSTFHAGSAAQALSRLLDMGIEPYVVRSGVLHVLGQRLLRGLCNDCAEIGTDAAGSLGLPVEQFRVPRGCPGCRHTGYQGRFVVAELLSLHAESVGRAVLARTHAAEIERQAVAAGMQTMLGFGLDCVQRGRTSPAEYRRVFGFASTCLG